MQISKLRDWMFEKGLDDQWYFAAEGVPHENVMTLSDIQSIVTRGTYQVTQVLHVSQAAMENPPWVDVELLAKPPRPPQRTQAPTYQAPVAAGFVQDGKKDPGIAAVLSLVIPGAGQIYNGQVVMGIVLLFVTAIGYATIIIGLIVHIWLVFDAYKTAKKLNGTA